MGNDKEGSEILRKRKKKRYKHEARVDEEEGEGEEEGEERRKSNSPLCTSKEAKLISRLSGKGLRSLTQDVLPAGLRLILACSSLAAPATESMRDIQHIWKAGREGEGEEEGEDDEEDEEEDEDEGEGGEDRVMMR